MLSYGRGATVPKRVPPAVVLAQIQHDPLSSRILDQLQLEIVVLDDEGIVLFCNDRARRLIDAHGAVGVSPGGRLYFVERETERKFQCALRQLVSGALEEDGATLFADQGSDNPKLIISIRVIANRSAAERSQFLVTFSEIAASLPEARMQQLMQSFGLTFAERRLTHYLTSGGNLCDAAKTFGVSRHTVRNQLRSVFDKVGVQRQADLTRVMFGGCGYGARC